MTAHVLLEIAGQGYGIPANRVDQVLSCERVTPIPGGPRRLSGITNVEGQLLPVVDIVPQAGVRRPLFVIVRCGAGRCALLVDAVTGLGPAGQGLPMELADCLIEGDDDD